MAQQPPPLRLYKATPNQVREFGGGEFVHPTALHLARKRFQSLNRDRGTTTPTATWTLSGFPATLTFDALAGGTNTNGDGTAGPVELFETPATTGASAGRITSAAIVQRSHNPIVAAAFATAASATNLGEWIALTDADLAGVDSPTTQSMVGIRFNTAAGDSSTFRAVTCDGGGTPTVVNGSVTRSNSTRYYVVFELDHAATEARIWLTDGSGVFQRIAAIATTLPAATTGLKLEGCVTTKTNTLKRFYLGHANVWSD